MVLPEALLKILVCPVDKGCLMYFADENLLYNPRLRRAYRIEGSVPVMLAERAEPVQEREHERLLMRARDGAAVLSAPGGPAAALASLSPSWRPDLCGLSSAHRRVIEMTLTGAVLAVDEPKLPKFLAAYSRNPAVFPTMSAAACACPCVPQERNILALWHTCATLVALWHPGANYFGLVALRVAIILSLSDPGWRPFVLVAPGHMPVLASWAARPECRGAPTRGYRLRAVNKALSGDSGTVLGPSHIKCPGPVTLKERVLIRSPRAEESQGRLPTGGACRPQRPRCTGWPR